MLSRNYRCKYFPPSSESNGRKTKTAERRRKKTAEKGRKKTAEKGLKKTADREEKEKEKRFRNQALEIFKLDVHQNDIIFSIEIFYACSI